jgi:hypothetical protein
MSGRAIRYKRGKTHQISVTRDKLSAFPQKLPSKVVARLPYPNTTTGVTSQRVGITGASDMTALGFHGTQVKKKCWRRCRVWELHHV